MSKSFSKIFLIIFAITCGVVSLPALVHAGFTPSVVHALDSKKSVWRNYYRDKFFYDMHIMNAKKDLEEIRFDDYNVRKAVKLRYEEDWRDSVNTLRDMATDLGPPDTDEIYFAIALIYESFGLTPEALGYYKRIEEDPYGDKPEVTEEASPPLLSERLAKEKPLSEFQLRTLLRSSFLKSIDAINYGSVIEMVKADKGFYKVFSESEEVKLWSTALAGHAVMLYGFGKHAYAEVIFSKLDADGLLDPAYSFVRAENHMNLGRLISAELIFRKIHDYAAAQENIQLLSYANLRLGDIAVKRGDYKQAELLYNEIRSNRWSDPSKKEPTADEGFIMRTLAFAELRMLENKYEKSILLLLDLEDEIFPPRLEMSRSLPLYFIYLYDHSGQGEKAFARIEDFLQYYPKNPWVKDIWVVIDRYIYKTIADPYAKNDYEGVLNAYYKFKKYVRQRRANIMIATAFMDAGLPSESKKIFEKLVIGEGRQSDRKAVSGLIRAHIGLGEVEEAERWLKEMKPRNEREQRLEADSKLLMADYYYRLARYREAAFFYEQAGSVLKDPEIYFKEADTMSLYGDDKGSVRVYNEIIGLYNELEEAAIRLRAMTSLGESYFKLKDYKNTLRVMKKAEPLLVEQSELSKKQRALYLIGESNYKLDRREPALNAWQRAVELNSESELGRLSAERIKEMKAWDAART